jgi:hypothetical protein
METKIEEKLCIHNVSEIHSTQATKDIYINVCPWRLHLLSYDPVHFRSTIKITHKPAHWKVPVYKSMTPILHITIFPCASTHGTRPHSGLLFYSRIPGIS